jgi:hypothetical protein
MRLELGDRVLELADDRDGPLVVGEWELTFPEVRAVNDGRPGADGEDDESSLFGARALTLRLRTRPGERQAALDALYAFCHPGSRPKFYFADGGPERVVTLRSDTSSAPISGPSTEVGISWRVPYPFAESAVPIVAVARPAGSSAGRGYPLTFPRAYPAAGGSGVTVENVGNRPGRWDARFFGACTSPTLTNATTGESLSFPGLSIADTEYVEVDSFEQTVRVNGLASASRFQYVDPASTWWKIRPGVNRLILSTATSGPTTQVEVTTRSAWI